MELDLVGKAMLNILNDLSPHTITYERLLEEISQYEVGSEIQVSYSDYSLNKKIYGKAITEGYILHKITKDYSVCRFMIIKSPEKCIDEEIVNLYFS